MSDLDLVTDQDAAGANPRCPIDVREPDPGISWDLASQGIALQLAHDLMNLTKA